MLISKMNVCTLDYTRKRIQTQVNPTHINYNLFIVIIRIQFLYELSSFLGFLCWYFSTTVCVYHVCHKSTGITFYIYAHYLAEGSAVFSPYQKGN